MNKNFTQIPNLWLRDPRLDANEKIVLFCIKSYSQEFHPSHARLAEITGLNPKTVNKVLQRLKSKNVLEWVKGYSINSLNKNNNKYYIKNYSQWTLTAKASRVNGRLIILEKENSKYSRTEFVLLLEGIYNTKNILSELTIDYLKDWIANEPNSINKSEINKILKKYLKMQGWDNQDIKDRMANFDRKFSKYLSENTNKKSSESENQ